MIKIYTDGSCLENPGNGGWAAIINDNGNTKSPTFSFNKAKKLYTKLSAVKSRALG